MPTEIAGFKDDPSTLPLFSKFPLLTILFIEIYLFKQRIQLLIAMVLWGLSPWHFRIDFCPICVCYYPTCLYLNRVGHLPN